MDSTLAQQAIPSEIRLPEVGDIIAGVVVEEATKESIRLFWGKEIDWTPRETGIPNRCAESL
jgi:hypothetical protein